jgi:xanthine dehydrogenase accessory factor
MQKNLLTWQLILQSLQQQTGVMLLYVLESKGSSPGRQGFMMAVNAAGQMCGSLGGGIMEYKFVELAKEKLKEENTSSSIHTQIHDKAAPNNQSGMICSGEQTIFLYKVKKDENRVVESIISSLQAYNNGTLILSPLGISFLDLPPEKNFSLERSSDDFLLKEKTGYKQNLFIVGGGHCSLAFAQLMCGMDFYIHLYDDRPSLNTMELNCFVHEKKVLSDYSALATEIPSGENNYVVVMTFGYRSDDIAVRAILNKRFAYFGLLGSKKKVEKMFADYLAEGITEETLNHIHAPVGIAIKSQTPEEIAVSIAAEIIGVKNKLLVSG